jgi:hypothetical protein
MDHRHDDHHASDVHAVIILVIIVIAYALLWSAASSRFVGPLPSSLSHFEHTAPGPNMLPPL